MPPNTENTQILKARNVENGQVQRVWLLLDDRPGHATQVRGLAQEMAWAAVPIDLTFNPLNRLPNPFLGSSLVSLSSSDRGKLQAPFPAIVIGMGRRVVPIARWIKRQSGGKTRIVMLGRKATAKPSDIDLVVGCVHFNQIPREGYFELAVPPTQVNREILSAAQAIGPSPISALKRPRVVLLVGGPTAQHRFDVTDAIQLVMSVAKATIKLGGELAIVTSRRTPAIAVEAMKRAVPAAHIHVWQAGAQENPYLSYLANADLLVVTGESESMIAEAAAVGVPLTIYPLQEKPRSLKYRLATALRLKADQNDAIGRLSRYAMLGGWIVPPRDLALMHGALHKGGIATVFDGSLNTRSPLQWGGFKELSKRLAVLAAGAP